MQIVIDIPETPLYRDMYTAICENGYIFDEDNEYIAKAIKDGTPLTPNVLADMLMEERIRGELKQDISYSKDVIDNVRCKLTVEIIDRRPCYCGAELRAVWRERKENE